MPKTKLSMLIFMCKKDQTNVPLWKDNLEKKKKITQEYVSILNVVSSCYLCVIFRYVLENVHKCIFFN